MGSERVPILVTKAATNLPCQLILPNFQLERLPRLCCPGTWKNGLCPTFLVAQSRPSVSARTTSSPFPPSRTEWSGHRRSIFTATTTFPNRSGRQPGCRSLRSNTMLRCATKITSALLGNQCWWAMNASAPTRLRLGNFTTDRRCSVCANLHPKSSLPSSGKQINEPDPPTNINFRPDSQTANTGPPYRLHSSHQADVYLRTSEALAAAREQGVNRAAKPVNSGSPFSRP